MKDKDDFTDWSKYLKEYMQHSIIETYRNGFQIFVKNVGYEPGIKFYDNMSGSLKQVYTLVYRLTPMSVLECGCGGCYNIRNLRVLFPHIEVHGFDISKEQLSFGVWLCNIGREGLSVMDITKDQPNRKYDFVFTQAVIMHLSTDNAMKALNNVKTMSNKYIYLSENPDHHGGMDEWMGMVKTVFHEWKMTICNEFGGEFILLEKDD